MKELVLVRPDTNYTKPPRPGSSQRRDKKRAYRFTDTPSPKEVRTKKERRNRGSL